MSLGGKGKIFEFKARGPERQSRSAGPLLSGRLLFTNRLLEHVFRQNAVTPGGIVDQHVGGRYDTYIGLKVWEPWIEVNFNHSIGSLLIFDLLQNHFQQVISFLIGHAVVAFQQFFGSWNQV